MPYTLAKWALWLIAAAAIGLVVGWMLRGVRRSPVVQLSDDESKEHGRLRDLEQDMDRVVNERERLRIELDDCRTTAMLAPSPRPEPVDHSERDRLAALVAAHETTIGDLRARLWNHEAKIGELQGLVTSHNLSTAPADPDLEHGAEVLGEKVRLNDLTVVEGIGPKIADLLQTTGGIKTWWELHRTDVTTLRTLLEGAGPRFRVHDPSSWPQQAGLLARGEWEDFKDLTAHLQSGRFDG
ncbi:MAG TPA: hypothetical protein PK020_10665 [Ilumatobacteraceae bacterium]|nr:hypothetical protein [Ilumatobacteraceae bacterium]HRB05193.1 hypothetical protein [Ilumatobacteraceae bacterium]